jgi:hypothetical protein
MRVPTNSFRAASAFPENRFHTPLEWLPGQTAEPFEISIGREFRLRGLAWSVSFSAIFWCGLFAAGRELWSLWR